VHKNRVRNTRRFLLITLLIAAVGTVSWLLLRPDPGPMYEGKPLTAWLEGFDTGNTPSAQENTREAVQQLGTNAQSAVPDLLKALADPSTAVRNNAAAAKAGVK
jgi:hypothetical protein